MSADKARQASRRAGNISDLTVLGVGAVSAVAMAGAVPLWMATGSVWVGIGVPAAAIVLSVIAAAMIQRRAGQ